MNYKIIIEKNAKKYIQKQQINDQKRILKAISLLPEVGDIKPLKGEKDFYRLRVGTHRIIYRLDNGILTVIVIAAGSRGDIYKHL